MPNPLRRSVCRRTRRRQWRGQEALGKLVVAQGWHIEVEMQFSHSKMCCLIGLKEGYMDEMRSVLMQACCLESVEGYAVESDSVTGTGLKTIAVV